jgi:DNA-binding NarL/FixJ family response regulator
VFPRQEIRRIVSLMNDPMIDRASFPSAGSFSSLAPSSDVLLQPGNPGQDMLSPEGWGQVAQHLHLSARELSVAILIVEGQSRAQIARRLHCAPGTIRVYIDRLFAKLNVADRLEMALRVVRVAVALGALEAQPAVSH